MIGEGALGEVDPATRARVQRHTLFVLMAGAALGSASLGGAFTVSTFIVEDILGSGRLGGLATAGFTLGAAAGAIPLSRLMARRGRRPGLQLGYLVASLGGVVAILGAQEQLLTVFLAGQFLFGLGQASNLLARYAAADLALPDHRGRAISLVLVCASIGAVLGPVLVGPAEAVAEALGMYVYTGPYLLSTVFYLAAAANIALRLRPDPLVVSGGIDPDGGTKAPPIGHALRVISAYPRARLALGTNVISQMTMVGVMTMTPLHMRAHGHEGISQYVVALHVAGMYAFAPLVGRYADRHGRLPTVTIAGALLVASCIVAAVAGEAPLALFVALWLLGIGWSFGIIGGSALLTESVPVKDRVAVQGTSDLFMSFAGAVAGFSSGIVREAWGYHMLSNLGTIAAGALLVTAFAVLSADRRRSRIAFAGGGGGT